MGDICYIALNAMQTHFSFGSMQVIAIEFNIPFLSSGELRLTQLTRATPLKLVLKCGFSRRGAINTTDASNVTEI